MKSVGLDLSSILSAIVPVYLLSTDDTKQPNLNPPHIPLEHVLMLLRMHAAGYKSKWISFECALIAADKHMADWEWEEVLTMQTWISLLAENEGSQVMDTVCSKEKFFTTYKRLSCLHTSSTVKPWTRRRNEANVNTHGKTDAIKKKRDELGLHFGSRFNTLSGWDPPHLD